MTNGRSARRLLAIVIPAFNEAGVIRRAIWSAYRAGVPPRDVYVVDDGSTDDTAALAWLLNAHVLTIVNAGKAQALKCGLAHFGLAQRYEWIMILDADSVLEAGYVAAIRRAIVRHPDAALICGNQRSQRGNWLTAYRAVQYAIWCGVYREAQHFARAVTVAPGFASTYRASTLALLDFDAGTLTEDMDMTIQLHRRGEEIVYAPDAIVYTQDPLTLREYVGQTMRWYRGTWQVIAKRQLGRHASRVDVEMALLMAENVLVGCAVATLPFWAYFYPWPALAAVALDQLVFLGYTVLTARRECRLDVLAAFPTFLVPRVLDYLMFAWAFLTERRRRSARPWFSVARY